MSTSEHATGAMGALLQRPRRLGYHCGTCGAAFATQARVDEHLRHAYHGCQCLACGAVYATSRSFDAHMRWIHGQGRPQDQAEPWLGAVCLLNAGRHQTG